jgi:hypothetical protein
MDNGHTTDFNVPATTKDAQRRGGIIAEAIDRRDWERAAIVRAFCQPTQGKRTSSKLNEVPLSFADFARLKIPGLTSRTTIGHYWHAWELTDLPEPEPGKTVTIPSGTTEFPHQPISYRDEPDPLRSDPLRSKTPDTSGFNVAELEAATQDDYDPEPSGDKPDDIRPRHAPQAKPVKPPPPPIENTILDEVEGLLANCDFDKIAASYSEGNAFTLLDSIENMLNELRGKYVIRAVPKQRNRRKASG